MNVLSLFDGISCGQLALAKAGIVVGDYYSSEIDSRAIKVTNRWFPSTIQVGNVCTLNGYVFPKIDILLGGSPCQGFSTAGKLLNFNDPRSKLFFEYVRILKAVNPTYFLLENVMMKQEWQDIISEHLGVQPIEINSSLVSAQNRVRLYWTNIPNVLPPKDKNLTWQSVVKEVGYNAKYTIPANYLAEEQEVGSMRGRYLVDGKRQDGKMRVAGLTQQYVEFRTGDKKTNTLTTVKKDNVVVPCRLNERILATDFPHRYLTAEECEALQNIPLGYTNCVPDSHRFKLLGNAWTVDVIAHILSFIK